MTILTLSAVVPWTILLAGHGATLIEEFEDLSHRDPRLAQAMSGVWCSTVAAGPAR
jgi:hypothetical protein